MWKWNGYCVDNNGLSLLVPYDCPWPYYAILAILTAPPVGFVTFVSLPQTSGWRTTISQCSAQNSFWKCPAETSGQKNSWPATCGFCPENQHCTNLWFTRYRSHLIAHDWSCFEVTVHFFCISLILHRIICSVKCIFVQTKTQNVSYESINHQRSQQRSPKANLPATRSYLKQVMPVTSLSFTRVLFKSIPISDPLVHLITFSHRSHWKHNNNSKTHVIAGNGVKVLISVCIYYVLCETNVPIIYNWFISCS